jgi:HD-GYP domain-containing protein (c-di-GMP phosphodiesterase class II)
MKERQSVIQSGVSDQFKSFAAIVIGTFALFQLFIGWFAHDVLPILDGSMLAVTVVIVVYLWIRQAMSLQKCAIVRAQLVAAQVATIGALVRTIEAKDPYTRGHSSKVAKLSVELAKKLELPAETIAVIERGAVLHDIGKLGIADSILGKKSSLNDGEWLLMKDHARRSHDILSALPFLERESRIALLHHERYDGSGYGLGLKADEIPIEAAIVAVADGFDAMNSDRPYRDRMPRAQVIAEITKGRGSQYHPGVADTFLALLKGKPELWARDGASEVQRPQKESTVNPDFIFGQEVACPS